MSASRFLPTRAAHLSVVAELFPGLRSPEMRGIVATMTRKRLRRVRMDLEDRANGIRMPAPTDGRA